MREVSTGQHHTLWQYRIWDRMIGQHHTLWQYRLWHRMIGHVTWSEIARKLRTTGTRKTYQNISVQSKRIGQSRAITPQNQTLESTLSVLFVPGERGFASDFAPAAGCAGRRSDPRMEGARASVGRWSWDGVDRKEASSSDLS
eukprot:3827684-Rhodomonas_salina.1